MRTILAIIFMTLANQAIASSTFVGEEKVNPSLSECSKVIENGTLVLIGKNYRTYFYRDKLVTIMAVPSGFQCTLFEDLEKQ